MRTKLYFLLIMYMLIGRITGQELLPSIFSSGGNHATSQSYKLSYTLGQAISTTHIKSTNNVVGIGYQQFMDSTDIVPFINKYNIGEIPDQIVYFKTNLAFDVYSKELGLSATLSIKPSGIQKGIVVFKPEKGSFEYKPDSLDFKPFTVDFIAIKDLDTIRQSVLFNCIAYLPYEQTVFGIDNNSFIPDSLDKDYIILNSTDNPGQEMFNNSMKKTRNISIIGKTVVFENGHKSGFYNYNKNADIKTFTVYAQTLIIRSPLDLPQTNVTIFAENIEFSDNAYLSIKPEKNQQNATQNNNGSAGMDAGEIKVYVKNFKASSGIRFFLNGAEGQNSTTYDKNPGNGGKGGNFTSNIGLENYVDNIGGNPGGGGTTIALRGANGSYVREWNSTYKWLHPFWLKMLVKFSKDSYLEGNLSFTVSSTEKYIREVDVFSQTSEWQSSDIFIKTELQQISYEINSIIQRVNSNLDFFGNPAGWTPMLSFEANKTIFENEIERSIRTMYLAYWIKNAISSLEQKVASLSHARNELSIQLENNIASFNILTELIPALEDEIREITLQTDSLQQELIRIEELLAARAEQIVKDKHKVPSWKKYTAIAGQIMQVIPVYQPAMGTVGTALIEISKYDTNKSVLENYNDYKERGIDKLFTDEKLKGSNKEIKDLLKTIDPNQVKDLGSAQDYSKTLIDLAKKGQEKYTEILGIIKKEKQVPKDEIEAVLSNLKASDPAFNQLADKIAVLLSQKESLINKILNVNDNIQKLNSEISVSLLGMDGLNKNVSAAQNVLDDRVKVYLDDMENRAKERLLKYHYFMKKAYEFRMVTPYTQTLNLQNIFDRFKLIADSTNSSSLLSESQFLSLKSLYDDQIARIAEQIFNEYNQNIPEFTAPLRFSLTKQQLKSLDGGNPVVINLVEMGLFNPNEENLRITDINIFSIDVKSSGQINSTSFFNIDMVHSGISKLRKGGKAYLFRNYNNRTERPIGWYFKFDRFSNKIDKIPLSFASQSLLTTMMSIKGIPTNIANNILLYSRPAAWADIVITKSVHPNSTSKMNIDSLVLELQYDFQRMPTNLVAFNVSATENLKPLVEISRKDNNNRQNGYGSISRVYNRSSSQQLTISVPRVLESFVFDRWTDPNGNDLGPLPLKDTTLSLSLSFGTSVKANYSLINPILDVSVKHIDVGATGGIYNINIKNTGNGNLEWRAEENSNWINIIDGKEGVNAGIVKINISPISGSQQRSDTVLVISENSQNFIEKIVIIQKGSSSTPPPWTKIQTGENHTVIIPANVQSDIAGVPLKSGDYIGVFFQNNGQVICSNFMEWSGAAIGLAAYGNDASSPAKNGFNSAEVFRFKIWRGSESKEYDVTATFEDPPQFPRDATDKWKKDGLSMLTKIVTSSKVTQVIQLRPAWNMISSYVIPDKANMLDVISALDDKVILIKDESGASTIPSAGINGIGNWDIRKGYKIRMSESTTLSVTGEKANPSNTSISIAGGWKIISYLCDNGNIPSEQFSSISNSLVLVKDQDGKSYIPSAGIDGIGCLKPGLGYQVRGQSNASFNYTCTGTCNPGISQDIVYSRNTENFENEVPFNSGNNATIVFSETLARGYLKIGEEILAFNSQGLLCGRSNYNGNAFAFPVWGDDLETPDFNEGLITGETIYFKIKDLDGNLQNVRIDFENQNNSYSLDEIYFVESLERKGIVKEEIDLIVFPNPTSNNLNVQIMSRTNIHVLDLTIYNMQGKVIDISKNVKYQESKNSWSILTENIDQGVYIFNFKIGDKIFNKKVIIIK